MNDILRLLDDVSLLLGSPVKKGSHEYPQPCKVLQFAEFLVPAGETIPDINHLMHLYGDQAVENYEKCNGPASMSRHARVVLHGHTRESVCTAPHFCHVQGYIPDPSLNPMFIRNFNLKWNREVKKTVEFAQNYGNKNPHVFKLNPLGMFNEK